MEYQAKTAYRSRAVVDKYDRERFKNLKGSITNRLELRLVGEALKSSGILPPARLLDVPCGTGRLTEYLLEKGYRVRGADISPEMVRYTNQRLGDRSAEDLRRARVENAENLSFPDAAFEATVSLRLFGHTPPEIRSRILGELKRVSADCLILAYYDRLSLAGIIRKVRRGKGGITWNPVNISEIRRELDQAGLKIRKVSYLARGLAETMVVAANHQ